MTGAEMDAQVQSKIAEFSATNRDMAERLHQLIMEAVPTLKPRLWYGMPGYAKTKDSAVLCFFREDACMTFGLTEAVPFRSLPVSASGLKPCAWYFTELSDRAEQEIVDVVQKAVGV